MKRLHVLFSLNSLAVVLVSIERFSFTTRVLLQPYQFLRLHEAVQLGDDPAGAAGTLVGVLLLDLLHHERLEAAGRHHQLAPLR